MSTFEIDVAGGERTLYPVGEAADLLHRLEGDSLGRVLVKLPDPHLTRYQQWTPTVDLLTQLDIDVRRADCGEQCACAAEVRLHEPTAVEVAAGTIPWPRRASLQLHVVLELNDMEDYFTDDPADLPATLEQVKVKLEGDLAGFVLNEVNNTAEYGATVVAIEATVTEVSD